MTHASRLRRLTALLAGWQELWRPAPFHYRQMPWIEAYPALHEYLLTLGDEECARREQAPFSFASCAKTEPATDSPPGPDALSRWLPVTELAQLAWLPELPEARSSLPNAWAVHVAGRKWQQLEAFVHQVELPPGQPVVEWCAGKGHLARTLKRLHGNEVSALEWQPELCWQGQQLAERQDVAIHLAQQDVLAPDAKRWLSADTHVVALHACGDLHTRLLEQAAASGCALTLAPCCYQRTMAPSYRPLSRLGRQLMNQHNLRLERDDLALAVQETVTAPAAVRRQRERANAWRLGFDLLQRTLRDRDEYLPVPSLAYGRLPNTFEGFCRWAARQKALVLPVMEIDWGHWETLGWQRLDQVKRLELVRHLFRRPLEVWLVLDRALMLEEAGYHVELGVFCKRNLTPRNLLLKGTPK